MSFGTLADPVITPAAGVHPYGQTVTMSAPGAGSIRYTTDGTTPGVASLLYTEPLGTGWIVDDQSSRLPPRLDRERNIDRRTQRTSRIAGVLAWWRLLFARPAHYYFECDTWDCHPVHHDGCGADAQRSGTREWRHHRGRQLRLEGKSVW